MQKKFMKHKLPQAIFWLLVTATLSLTTFAQGLNGAFTGTAKDATGGVIPNATVKITSAATSVVVFTGVTDAEGNYLAPALPTGQYDFVFEAGGFKRYERRGVVLEIGQRARVDAQLEPGAVTDAVQITDNGTVALDTETSSFEYSIKPEDISNLPLPSRDVLGLLGIVSGVSTDGDPTNPNTESISINGSRTLQTEISVDGVSGLTGGTGRILRSPSAETLQEVRVLTSAYSAEFGRTSGGFINGVFKSGGKQYHGAVYEYFRNDKLNANNFFRNLRGEQRPPERYNQFGLSLGGPLWTPNKLTDWRRSQNSFFFFNFEGIRRVSPGTAILDLPSAAFRSGDFSASPVLIKDPALRLPCTAADRRGCFAGNKIPDARLDPAARKILSLAPLPNTTGVFDAATGRATDNFLNPNADRFENEDYNLRLDRTAFKGRTRLSARVTHYQRLQNNNRNMPGILANNGTTIGGRGWQTSLNWTQQWSAKFLTESFFGFGRIQANVVPPYYGDVDPARDLGIARSALPVTPRLNITGWTSYGPGDNTLRRQADNIFQPSVTATWVRPKGTIKFGAQLRRNHFNILYSDGRAYGIYNFNGEVTSTNSASGNAINALADFLLGQVKTSEYELSSPLVGRRNYNLGLFVQNDWKVKPRLTLNLGVRYEYESPMKEVNNNYSRIDTRTGKLLVAGRNASDTLDLKAAKNNFGPRIGFAWSVNPRTVVRSAFGVFYSQTFGLLNNTIQFPGFFSVSTFASRGAGVAQDFTLSQGMPLNAVRNLNDPFAIERAATTANPLSFNGQFSELTPLGSTMQWNFGLQRELPKKTFLEVSYVASRGLHLPLALPFNDVPFDRADELVRVNVGTTTQSARPFPTVSRFRAVAFAGTSSYHSLQVRARRQVKDFSVFSAYTWSKAIDDGTGVLNFGQPNGEDPGQFLQLTRYLDRAVSNFDRRHTASITWQYRPNFGANFFKWTRGFLFTGIFVARTGLPDTITQNNFNPVVQQQRPDAIGPYGAIYASERTNVGNGIRYLVAANGANFPLAPTGPFYTGTGANRRRVLPTSIGTLGRNTVRGPGEWSQDFSLIREFRLREKLRFQLRGEAFNVFNHTNFNGPNTALNVIATTVNGQDAAVFNSPNFGLITTAKASRFMQLVARIEF